MSSLTRRLAVTVAAVVGLVSACGTSGYTYVTNQKDGLYLKVPDSWKVYTESDFVGDLSADEREDLRSRTWFRGFDAAADPSTNHVVNRSTSAPRGYAEVVKFDQEQREESSLETLRANGFSLVDTKTGEPVDPVRYAIDNPDGAVRILHYDDELTSGDGFRGIRITAFVDLGTEPAYVLDQVTFVDVGTTKRYTLSIGCSPTCWTKNRKLLATIVDSWTLENPSEKNK